MRAAHSGQTCAGPQCTAEKSTSQSNLSAKLFPCPFPSAPWQDLEVGLPAQGASQQAVSQCLHLGCKRTPPRAGFHRLCPWPGAGVCHLAMVPPGWLARAPVITALHQGVYQTKAPHNSSSVVRVSNPALPSPIKTSMWGSGRRTRSRCTHRCSAASAPQDSAYCDKHCEKDRTGPSQAREMV